MLIGSFINDSKLSVIALNIAFIPFQALSQSPLNTPDIKSINPPNASSKLPTCSVIAVATIRNALLMVSNTNETRGPMKSINQATKGAMQLFHNSLKASANLPSTSIALLITG